MTPLQALAHAVQAGKAGLPPAPEALAELGAMLQALEDGADPAKMLSPPAPRGRPYWSALRDRNFWRVVTVVELMQAGRTFKEARDRVLDADPRTGAQALDPGVSDSQLRKHVQRWRKEAAQWLADDAEEPDLPPFTDRPNASQEFKV